MQSEPETNALEEVVIEWRNARKSFFSAPTIRGPDKKDSFGWVPIEEWHRLANAESALMKYAMEKLD